MGFSGRSTQPDPDPVATQEWQDSIRAVEQRLGSEEAKRLLHATLDAAKQAGVDIDVVNTPYLNSIHPDDQGAYPGDLDLGGTPPRRHSMECHDDGHESEQVFRWHWRAYLDLCIGLTRLGNRLQSFLPRQRRRRCWRPLVLARARLTRDLRSGLARRAPHARGNGTLPPRSWRTRVCPPTPTHV